MCYPYSVVVEYINVNKVRYEGEENVVKCESISSTTPKETFPVVNYLGLMEEAC